MKARKPGSAPNDWDSRSTIVERLSSIAHCTGLLIQMVRPSAERRVYGKSQPVVLDVSDAGAPLRCW